MPSKGVAHGDGYGHSCSLARSRRGVSDSFSLPAESSWSKAFGRLQYLTPRQRPVLVLRDVLEFPAAEVAVMLGSTTASVKSALQRAWARLEEACPAADQVTEPAWPEAGACHQR